MINIGQIGFSQIGLVLSMCGIFQIHKTNDGWSYAGKNRVHRSLWFKVYVMIGLKSGLIHKYCRVMF